jgi:hypothetical protein
VEGKCEQHVLFQVVVDLLDHETVLLRVILCKDQLAGLVLDLLLQQMSHSTSFNDLFVQFLLSSDILRAFSIVCLQYEASPSYINVRVRIYLPALLFRQLQFDHSKGLAFCALRNVDQNRSQRTVLVWNRLFSLWVSDLDSIFVLLCIILNPQRLPRHQVPQNVRIISRIMLFNLPQAFIKFQPRVFWRLFHFFQDDIALVH